MVLICRTLLKDQSLAHEPERNTGKDGDAAATNGGSADALLTQAFIYHLLLLYLNKPRYTNMVTCSSIARMDIVTPSSRLLKNRYFEAINLIILTSCSNKLDPEIQILPEPGPRYQSDTAIRILSG